MDKTGARRNAAGRHGPLLAPPFTERLQLQCVAMPSYPGARLTTLDRIAIGEATVSQVSAVIPKGLTSEGLDGLPKRVYVLALLASLLLKERVTPMSNL